MCLFCRFCIHPASLGELSGSVQCPPPLWNVWASVSSPVLSGLLLFDFCNSSNIEVCLFVFANMSSRLSFYILNFFFSIFLLLKLDHFYWSAFKNSDSSVSSLLLVSPSEFFSDFSDFQISPSSCLHSLHLWGDSHLFGYVFMPFFKPPLPEGTVWHLQRRCHFSLNIYQLNFFLTLGQFPLFVSFIVG